MSLWSRLANVFRSNRLGDDIDEELNSHLEEAVEHGRDPEEARRAFGSALRHREESRDIRITTWLDSLRADFVFGWRQLKKKKVTSAAAILSLTLAIGACTAAFRIIDALLLRPMPIAEPGRLYAMHIYGTGPSGAIRTSDSNEYPQFEKMRDAVKERAELIAASGVDRSDLNYGAEADMEKAYRQYVSGSMFPTFGLHPRLGRLLTEQDDLKPGAHPYAVLSYDYWTRRFGRDPNTVGRTFRLGDTLFQIIGVGPESFTGTEPGTMADIFLPTMMFAGVTHDDWSWFRTFAYLRPGASPEPVRDRLQAVFNVVQAERVKAFKGWPEQRRKNFLHQTILVEPAGSGVSEMRKEYRPALIALAVLVGLVLLIACANLANLLIAQGAARGREMALRVSIGAGRWRLAQLMLVESGLLAVIATVLAAGFAWWAAPFVVARINSPDHPARLALDADWRVLGFALALATAVTVLFGSVPAFRASSVKPSAALKGGEDPHSRRRWMHALIAAQVAFGFVVLFVAGLFISTFNRLANQPTGFSADRLLVLDTVAKPAQPTVYWDQLRDHLRHLPGVESVGFSGWALMSGNGMNGFVSVNGQPPHDLLGYFLNVSPGWLDTMKIPLIDGRDFRPGDTTPGAAIVNEAFAKEYFPGQNPIGKSFLRTNPANLTFEIVGLVRDARYRDMREPITPTAYIPRRSNVPDGTLGGAAILLRTSAANPLSMASILRQEIPRIRSEFRVSNIRTQQELNDSQLVRERLIAMLASFFAVIALLLAGVGLYGVLDYSVVQRRREIGIRIAIGAKPADIAIRVTSDVFAMVLAGSVIGIALGFASARYIATLLYQVKSTDPGVLAIPACALLLTAIAAAVPAVLRAVRLDPIEILRAD